MRMGIRTCGFATTLDLYPKDRAGVFGDLPKIE